MNLVAIMISIENRHKDFRQHNSIYVKFKSKQNFHGNDVRIASTREEHNLGKSMREPSGILRMF